MGNSGDRYLPDYNQIAGDFDRFLPQIHPVTLALLDHLPPPRSGETVLDVACGTGEPGLTLARRSPEMQLLGVDGAAAMIEIARAKAAREGLANARFEVMPIEQLAIDSSSADSLISRFGLLMFGDVPASARELARVLRSGGHFSLAVWDALAQNTLVGALFTLLRGHLPPEYFLPFDRMSAWAAEGARAKILNDVGLTVVNTESFGWHYAFDSFEEAWALLSGPGTFARQLTALTPEALQRVKTDLCDSLSAYRQNAGAYRIPHTCRLFWGQR